MEVSGWLHTLAPFILGNKSLVPIEEEAVGSRTGLDAMGKNKKLN
jgi:hypothetical protein